MASQSSKQGERHDSGDADRGQRPASRSRAPAARHPGCARCGKAVRKPAQDRRRNHFARRNPCRDTQKEGGRAARAGEGQERAGAGRKTQEAPRIAHGKESSLWSKVDELIATKLPKRYDEAVSILQDLHDLAAMQGKSSDFSFRMRALHNQHARKPSLVERFRTAKLL